MGRMGRIGRTLLVFAMLVFPALPALPALHAQPLERISGRVVNGRGEPMKDALVRIEAIFGFAGSDFLGQRTFSTRSDAKGGWALLGFKAGLWMFDAVAPGQVPDSIALPFYLVSAQGSGIGSALPIWHPVLRPTALPDGEFGTILSEATEAAVAGRSDRVTPLLARLSESNDVNVLNAAGRICLVMRDATVARPLFRRAFERDPQSFRAALGLGSSALMQRDVDAAAKSFGVARNLTKDKDERSYLSAAISELNKTHNVMRGTD